MLSVAEVYEPNYFLLENVTGLLQHSVTSKAGDGGLVKKATLKLIIRCLLALNYTVRFKVLQAGQYGAPQVTICPEIVDSSGPCSLAPGQGTAHLFRCETWLQIA